VQFEWDLDHRVPERARAGTSHLAASSVPPPRPWRPAPGRSAACPRPMMRFLRDPKRPPQAAPYTPVTARRPRRPDPPVVFPTGDACARQSPRATPLTDRLGHRDTPRSPSCTHPPIKRQPLSLPVHAPLSAARHCRCHGEHASPPAPTAGQATEHLA
jgi:hypothetical protein